MAAWTAAAHAERAQAPRARSAPRARPQRRVTGGVFWIAAVAVLLAGVVAMNVTVLRLNITLERLGRERANLQAQNAQLFSELSSAAAAGRIQALAIKRLGYVPAGPDQTTYVQLDR
jgi:cell division protein FtsL